MYVVRGPLPVLPLARGPLPVSPRAPRTCRRIRPRSGGRRSYPISGFRIVRTKNAPGLGQRDDAQVDQLSVSENVARFRATRAPVRIDHVRGGVFSLLARGADRDATPAGQLRIER